MYIIENGIDKKQLHKIANAFYTKINPIKKSGVLYKNSLNKRVKKKYTYSRSKKKKYFYNLLIEKDFRLLKSIIKGTPSELKAIVQKMERLVSLNKILPFYEIIDGKKVSTDFGEEVLDLFDYTGCRGSLKFVWWANEIGNRICPYCNYEPTFMAEYKN